MHVGAHLPDDWNEFGRDDEFLFLADIVVAGCARRQGLATATLQEFTAYADHAGLPILAEFLPDHVIDGGALASVAAWYYQLGFRVDEYPDASTWVRGSIMSRLPVRPA